MLLDTSEITAVPAARFRQFGGVLGGRSNIGEVAVCEAVGHEEVHDVRGGKAFEPVSLWAFTVESVWCGDGSVWEF